MERTEIPTDPESRYVIAEFVSKLEILERIEELESKTFRNNRPEISLKPRLLLLKHSGILEKINDLFKDLALSDKAAFVSALLDIDYTNTVKALMVIENSHSDLETSRNYKLLVDIFKKVGLKEQELLCEKRFADLEKNEDSQRKG